ncbi:MAG TPA: TetR/AcrR family transcriptional regulator [Vicinamibacteria bacterium]
MRSRPGRPGRKARYHHGDLRRALLAQAEALVAEEGLSALTLREVARRSGVSQAAPYRHFPSKLALIAAVAEEGFGEMLARVRRALARAPREHGARLAALSAAYVRFAVDHPARFRVMFGREVAESHGYAGLWNVAQEGFGLLVGEIVDAQEAKVLPGDDPRGPALAAWSATHGLALLLVDGLLARQGLAGPGRSVEALAREVTASLLDGLRHRPARAHRPRRASRTPK